MTSTAKPELRLLSPSEIRANPENPRLHFPPGSLDGLMASIDESGILVPISVYKGRKLGATQYVLIDGERRWRSAKKLGLTQVPAIVIPPPDSIENLTTMFNIHMLRDPWDDMPTAWALKKLTERTDEKDLGRLADMTGLHVERLRRFKLANELPSRYQKYIDKGRVPLNFFYELDKYVIRPLAEKRPELYERLGRSQIQDAFVKKKLARVVTDTVSLRRVAPMITVAARDAQDHGGKTSLDSVLEQLITTPEATIEDAYDRTVGVTLEAEKFAKQCELLTLRLNRVMDQPMSAADRRYLSKAVRQLSAALGKAALALSK